MLGPRERGTRFCTHYAEAMKQGKQKSHEGHSRVNLLIVGHRQARKVFEDVVIIPSLDPYYSLLISVLIYHFGLFTL